MCYMCVHLNHQSYLKTYAYQNAATDMLWQSLQKYSVSAPNHVKDMSANKRSFTHVTRTHICISTHARAHTHLYICTHVHTHMCTHTHVHIGIQHSKHYGHVDQTDGLPCGDSEEDQPNHCFSLTGEVLLPDAQWSHCPLSIQVSQMSCGSVQIPVTGAYCLFTEY